MKLLSIILLTVSDSVLLFAQIIILSLMTGKQSSKSKTAVSNAIIFLMNILFELFFYKLALPIQYIAISIYSIKVCILTLYVLNSKSLRHMFILLIIQFLCSILNSGIYAVITFDDKSYPVFFQLSTLLIIRASLLLISIIMYRRVSNTIITDKSAMIPTYIYFLIIIDIFIQNGLIEGLSYETSNVSLKIKTAKILLFFLIICTSIIIISLAMNVIHKKYYLTLTGMLEKQVNNQLRHYEKTEQMNTEIRKFRHDYTNHINCLSSMLKSQRYKEAEEYINNMAGKLPPEIILFRTGNYIADAILTDKQAEAQKHDTTILFEGCIIPDVNSTDLCIILSNALDNAIEACSILSGQKIISVYGNYQQGYFVLIIKNPTSLVLAETDKLPKTSKNDTVHHGFGLSNIKNTVDKYNGNMKISSEDGMFALCVTFAPGQ